MHLICVHEQAYLFLFQHINVALVYLGRAITATWLSLTLLRDGRALIERVFWLAHCGIGPYQWSATSMITTRLFSYANSRPRCYQLAVNDPYGNVDNVP